MFLLRTSTNLAPRASCARALSAAAAAGGGAKPSVKPESSHFSSGPCKKRPGWTLEALDDACLGRSHRSAEGKAKLKLAIDESKRILGIPEDYHLGIVPGSDTGAYEMAMWTMLGCRPVDVFYWESFGKGWFSDATSQLDLDVNEYGVGEYGEIPDLQNADMDNDVLFTWNGTTSGVRVPNADWISDDRTGLTFCDATSAAFAMDLPWEKLDVTTYSWQKVLGGEGGHGVLVLSPRAVERLETYTPPRPLPKVFRLTKKGVFEKGIFSGATINTPSMMCVEDYLDALRWTDEMGGKDGLIARADANLAALSAWVDQNDAVSFLAKDEATRSNTSVCLAIDGFDGDMIKSFTGLLEAEGVAVDIGAYRDAPPGLRIWCGATVETSDVEALVPWLEWAYNEVQA